MAQGFDLATAVEVFTASGVLAGAGGLFKWFFSGRKRERVDNAKIVQGMAMDLITPMHGELATLRASMAAANVEMSALRAELEQVLGYAILAHAYLIDDPAAPEPPPSVLSHKAF